MKTLTMCAPYAFIILCDSQAGDYPEWGDGDDSETYARSEDGLFIATRPDHIGPVTIELRGSDDSPATPGGFLTIFEGTLRINSGLLKAGSEISDTWVNMRVRPGQVRVRVYGDTIPDPKIVRVVLEVTP